MKVIFAGTPPFAACALRALIEAGHDIALVLTQPDRPAGRGMSLTPSAVKTTALESNLPLLQPLSLKNNPDIENILRKAEADVMVVAAYGLILPPSILDIPKLGCVNIHASLLPRWRGAAPIQRALLAGDSETGITLMQMDQGLDTGNIISQDKMPVSASDTSQSLLEKLGALGAKSIVRLLSLPVSEKFPSQRQNESLACYAPKIEKSEARIDWAKSAQDIEREMRVFGGMSTSFGSSPVKIWQVKHVAGIKGRPGEVMSMGKDGIALACGKDGVLLEVLQKPGAKKLPCAQFLSGFPVKQGDFFGS